MSAASVAHLLNGYNRAVKAAEMQEQRGKIELVSAKDAVSSSERGAMTDINHIQGLLPILPELVLALGAMVLLMIGAAAGERSAAAVNGLAVIVLIAAGAAIVTLPPGRYALFGGSFVVDDYARFLKLLALAGSAGALILSLDYLKLAKRAEIRIRRAVPALHPRHADADLGRRSDRALSRARADEPVALCGGGL